MAVRIAGRLMTRRVIGKAFAHLQDMSDRIQIYLRREARGSANAVHRLAREAQWCLWWFYIFSPIVGWLFTAFAISLDTPLWYDFPNRIATIR